MKMNGADAWNGTELSCRIRTKCMGRSLYYYDETDSTNLCAERLAAAGALHGTLAVADAQTDGRGRRGRSWESPTGRNVYFSLLLRPEISPDRTSMLTLVMALSVAEAIEKTGGCSCKTVQGYPVGDADEAAPDRAALIKWPNDIVMNGRKVCGILTELILEAETMQGVVIGVGINVNQQDRSEFPEQIREYAGSVRMAWGRKLDRADLIADIMQTFETNYETFLQTCDLTGLKESYQARLVNMGKQVKVLDPKGEYIGIAKGIDPFGELLVERSDGDIVNVYAGEVSVRGLYGYI